MPPSRDSPFLCRFLIPYVIRYVIFKRPIPFLSYYQGIFLDMLLDGEKKKNQIVFFLALLDYVLVETMVKSEIQ